MAASITDLPASPSGLLQSLAGCWALRRSIDNGASMIGSAMFIGRAGGWFDYAERGELVLADGSRLDAERRYLFGEEAGGFAVWFPETAPRLFHRIALCRKGTALVGAGRHLCGDDRYESRYEFRAGGSFFIGHAVTGPQKHYAIETNYTRNAT